MAHRKPLRTLRTTAVTSSIPLLIATQTMHAIAGFEEPNQAGTTAQTRPVRGELRDRAEDENFDRRDASAATSPLTPPPSASPVTNPPPGRGPDPRYHPTYDVLVRVGDLSQALVDRYPPGTRFALAPGIHRLLSPIVAKSTQQLLGMPGAVVSGARVLSRWKRSLNYWYVDGQTQRLKTTSFPCLPAWPLCNYSEDVFVDDRLLVRVGSREQLAPGKFWFDYSRNRIWIGENPLGRRVETSVAPAAFLNGSGNVIRNLVFEKFGNPGQMPAVGGTSLDVSRCIVRFMHGQGIGQYGGRIWGNVVTSNGQLGIGGGGDGLLVENNEISYNNTAGFDPGWEAGGTKWAYSNNLIVRGNWSHHNRGSGLSTDVNNNNTLYENNTVEYNGDIGIMHEISWAAVIRNNVIRYNGQRPNRFSSRAGINVTDSTDVEVYGNTLTDNTGGGIIGVQDFREPLGWRLRNLHVHDNSVQALGKGGPFEWANGLDVGDVENRSQFFSPEFNNRFVNNTYRVPALYSNGLWFITDPTTSAGSTSVNWTHWKATGQDRTGHLVTYS